MTPRNKLIMIRARVHEGDDRIQDSVEDIREASGDEIYRSQCRGR
jgi:hypothetical protein